MGVENQNIGAPVQEPEKKKHKIVIADVDIEQQARDIAEEKLTASKEDLKGFRGFFGKIWKHNLAHEYYRQKELSRARRQIADSGNLYAGEKGEKADHEKAMNAIVERFAAEYEGTELLRSGEEKKTLEKESLSGKEFEADIKNLIGRFAGGTLSEEQFQTEKEHILKMNMGKSDGKKNASMYADNLLEIAKQVKQNISHTKGLDALDFDLEIVLGKARTGVETEAQYSAVDKITDKIQKTFVGKFLNEATIASAVAIAYGVIAKGTVGVAHRGAKLVGVAGMGLSAGIGGAVAGVRENKRVKEERAQHGREMAKGKGIEKGSERREEMEKFRYETRDANELSKNLKESLENLKTKPSEEKLSLVLDHLNEINSRIAFSEQEKIDLIGFSDSKKVEQERTAMYIAVADAKEYLKKEIHADWATPYNDEKGLEDYLSHIKENKIKNSFLGEKSLKDEAFNKMKRRKVAAAVTKGLAIGLGVGALVQEIGAVAGTGKEGLFSGETVGSGQEHHYTALGWLKQYIAGNLPEDEVISQQSVVGTKDFVSQHEELFSKIKRGVWADNDSPKFDKNELKLRWGGGNGTGIDAKGNYVFNVKQMAQDGSFHGEKNWNPQELMKEGKMKLLISLSGDTQNQVVEIPIDADGNAIIDPNSEIGKIAFENADGHAKFIGKFAEVGVMGESVDGVDQVNVLATHSGEGIDGMEITKHIDPVGYDIEAPFVIPMAPRRPMEKLGDKVEIKTKKEPGVRDESGMDSDSDSDQESAVSSSGQVENPKREKSEAEKQEEARLFQEFLKSLKTVLRKEDTPARAAALHTLYKLEKYSDIYAPTMEEGDKKFLELTRKLWDQLTTHEKPDLDAKSCLKLMELAGIKTTKLNYVKAGESAGSGITVDTSDQDGVVVSEYGELLIFDHHGKLSGRDTSAAKFVYETLAELGLLKKEEYLDKFIDFVTKCDNFKFTPDEMKKMYGNYHKNLYGLSHRMKAEDVIELFKNGVNPMADFSDDYLKTHQYFNPQKGKGYEPLSNLSEHMRNQMKKGKIALEKLEKFDKGAFVVDTGADRFGKILIDTKKKSSNGSYYNKIDGENKSNQLEVFNKGYDGYLIWSPMENSFVLYTQRKMDEDSFPGGLSQGRNVRGNMWMKPQQDSEKLTITLEEVLKKLKGSDFKIEGDLKKTLGVDMKSKEMSELLDEGNLTEDILKKSSIEAGVPLQRLLAEIMKPLMVINRKYQSEIKKIASDKNRTAGMNAVAIKLLLEYQEKKKIQAPIISQTGAPTQASKAQIKSPATPSNIPPIAPPNKPLVQSQTQERFENEVKSKYPEVFANLERQFDEQKIPRNAQLNFLEIVANANLTDDSAEIMKSAKFVFWRKDQMKFSDKVDTIRSSGSNEMEIVFGRNDENKLIDDKLVKRLKRVIGDL